MSRAKVFAHRYWAKAATTLVLVAACCGCTPVGAATTVSGTATGAPNAHPLTSPASTMPVGGSAAAALSDLPVKGKAPMTGYSRDQFGQAWSDDVSVSGGHNGCTTRSDILRRDLTSVILKAQSGGCTVLQGILVDPYTGRTIQFVRGALTSTAVQIDHLVPLGDAWMTGAQHLTLQQRTDMANDPLELLAADGPTNEAKGDGDAATWLPPDHRYRCTYVARQIAVKAKYHLWVTPAEKAALTQVLAACPGEVLPVENDRGVAVPAPRP